jgi:hypothetical protein
LRRQVRFEAACIEPSQQRAIGFPGPRRYASGVMAPPRRRQASAPALTHVPSRHMTLGPPAKAGPENSATVQTIAPTRRMSSAILDGVMPFLTSNARTTQPKVV